MLVLAADILAGILAVYALYMYIRNKRRELPLPPGPWKLPVLGNALVMPTEHAAQVFAKMGKDYGSDILHLNVFGTDIVVLNSYEIAYDMLHKGSRLFSSRPKSFVIDELAGLGYIFVMKPYDTVWRTYRRVFTTYFHPRKTEINRPWETVHVQVLLKKLAKNPDNHLSHMKHMVSSVALSMVYGLRIKPDHDPYVDIAERALDALNTVTTPGAFLINTFPILRFVPDWFPFTSIHRAAKEGRKALEDILTVPYKAAVDAMNEGELEQCFVYDGIVDMQKKQGIDVVEYDKTLREVAVMTYLGAVDTTYAALAVFVKAMMMYPKVQKRIQEELDKVLGGRLPEHDDMESIPYLTAVLRELLRWEPVPPTNLPHYNNEDAVFRGYYIPKGTIIVSNIGGMLYNETDYPNPHIFDPDRFFKDGKLCDDVRNPEDIVFGFGRRRCPGRHLAKSTLLLTMASILSTFDIEKAKDKNGNVVEPKCLFKDGGIIHPVEDTFPCSIKLRSKKVVAHVYSV